MAGAVMKRASHLGAWTGVSILVTAVLACGRAGFDAGMGHEGGPCYGNGTCNRGLVCGAEELCHGPQLLFADHFDGGISDAWRVMTDDAGIGGWSLGDGGLPTQSNVETGFSFLYLPALGEATDYRVVGRMRGLAGAGAMEIAYRIAVSPTQVAYYFCAYEPSTGLLLIQALHSSADGAGIDFSEFGQQQAVGYAGHESDWITMTVEAVGNRFRCKLDEVLVQELQVVAVVPAFILPQGAVGFKTFQLAAEFESIEIYDLSH
jgi:hypothetical protein